MAEAANRPTDRRFEAGRRAISTIERQTPARIRSRKRRKKITAQQAEEELRGCYYFG
jgi:hypothetical protein